MKDDKKCSCCGNEMCNCNCSKCPSKKIDNVLCMILKILKICVFAGLTLVLFNINGMLKAQKEYANAVAAMANGQQSNSMSGAQHP